MYGEGHELRSSLRPHILRERPGRGQPRVGGCARYDRRNGLQDHARRAPTPFSPFDARSAPDSRERACSTKATRAQGPPPGTRSERGEARALLGEVVHDLSSRATVIVLQRAGCARGDAKLAGCADVGIITDVGARQASRRGGSLEESCRSGDERSSPLKSTRALSPMVVLVWNAAFGRSGRRPVVKDHWPRYETASSGMEVVVGASDGDADEVRDGLRREHVNNRAMRLWQRQERVYAPDSVARPSRAPHTPKRYMRHKRAGVVSPYMRYSICEAAQR